VAPGSRCLLFFPFGLALRLLCDALGPVASHTWFRITLATIRISAVVAQQLCSLVAENPNFIIRTTPCHRHEAGALHGQRLGEPRRAVQYTSVYIPGKPFPGVEAHVLFVQ